MMLYDGYMMLYDGYLMLYDSTDPYRYNTSNPASYVSSLSQQTNGIAWFIECCTNELLITKYKQTYSGFVVH